MVARPSRKDVGKAKARATIDKNEDRGVVQYHPDEDQTLVLNQPALSAGLTLSLREELSENVTKMQ